MKTILITGAGGGVGTHLRRELAGRYALRLADIRRLKPGAGETFDRPFDDRPPAQPEQGLGCGVGEGTHALAAPGGKDHRFHAQNVYPTFFSAGSNSSRRRASGASSR